MINNKKVFLIYIICFFLFLTLYIFPNYSNYPRLFAFNIKEKLEKPFNYVALNFNYYLNLFKTNKELLVQLDDVKKENYFLRNINNYYKLLTSKYND